MVLGAVVRTEELITFQAYIQLPSAMTCLLFSAPLSSSSYMFLFLFTVSFVIKFCDINIFNKSLWENFNIHFPLDPHLFIAYLLFQHCTKNVRLILALVNHLWAKNFYIRTFALKLPVVWLWVTVVFAVFLFFYTYISNLFPLLIFSYLLTGQMNTPSWPRSWICKVMIAKFIFELGSLMWALVNIHYCERCSLK